MTFYRTEIVMLRGLSCIGCAVVFLLAGCATQPISEIKGLAGLQGHSLPEPVLQKSEKGCGPAAVILVSDFWRNSHPALRELEARYPNGMTPKEVIGLAEEVGLQSYLVRGETPDAEDLIWNEVRAGRPVILCASVPLAWWIMLENRFLRYASQSPAAELGRRFQHYFVGIALDKSGDVLVFDPRYGYLLMSQFRLRHYWAGAGYIAIVTVDSKTTQARSPDSSQKAL